MINGFLKYKYTIECLISQEDISLKLIFTLLRTDDTSE